MADVERINSGNDIEHGAATVTYMGIVKKLYAPDDRTFNTPVEATLATQYDDRWDDPRYYTGDAAT